MRNYWMRIALGALAIFAVGMVGISLVRRSIGGVRAVAEGTDPITLPLAFVAFKLNGQKLGTVNRVVLHRDAPKRLAGVELGIKLNDSVLARGLEGCRLAANLDSQRRMHTEVDVGSVVDGVFSCLHAGDSAAGFQEFGHAIFQPGNVSVPLLLPSDIVDDLRQGDLGTHDLGMTFEDSVERAAEAAADSIAEEAEAYADSISLAASTQTDSVLARTERLVDSLRREGVRRSDSARGVPTQMADPPRSR